jgi:hypothetical protein
MELKNKSGLNFQDISSEYYRIYEFENKEIKITNPLYLNVSPSGGHRILDADGVSHYIPSKWLHLRWLSRENSPNFSF